MQPSSTIITITIITQINTCWKNPTKYWPTLQEFGWVIGNMCGDPCLAPATGLYELGTGGAPAAGPCTHEQLTVSCRISGCHAMNLKKMSNRVRGKCKCRLRCVSLFLQCSTVYVGCSTWSVILFIYIFCTNFCILILFLHNIFVYWYYF